MFFWGTTFAQSIHTLDGVIPDPLFNIKNILEKLGIKPEDKDFVVKEILNNTFDNLSFDNLVDIKFVGDGTYLKFSDKYIEIRPSGTDAKTKAYGGGEDLESISKFAKVLGNYSGERTDLHKKLISEDFYEKSNAK